MQELRLFKLAVEVIHLDATFVAREGWRLTVIARTQGQHWNDSYRAVYSHLSTTELADVISCESERQLGLV